jgi:hypothetical protein
MTGTKIDWQTRRDGFDQKHSNPTNTPINWKYWGSLQVLQQWQACALSLNINPDDLRAKPMPVPGKPVFNSSCFPSADVHLEFDKRLTMLIRQARGNPLAVVSPAVFAAWCLRVELENLPLELTAMAETVTAATMESESAQPPAPLVVSSNSSAKRNRKPSWSTVAMPYMKSVFSQGKYKSAALFYRVLLSRANTQDSPFTKLNGELYCVAAGTTVAEGTLGTKWKEIRAR